MFSATPSFDDGHDNDTSRNGASRTAPSATFYGPIGLDAEVTNAANRIHSGIRLLCKTMLTDDDVDNGDDDDPPENGASCMDPPVTSYRTIDMDVKVASAIQLTHSVISQLHEMMRTEDDDDTVQTDHHGDDGCYDDPMLPLLLLALRTSILIRSWLQ